MQIDRYADQYNVLTQRILKHCASEHPGENVFISPLSILLLLSIAADSTTRAARDEILGFLNNQAEHNDAGIALGEFQRLLSRTGVFSSANAVCVRSDFAQTVNKSYTDLILPGYNASLFSSNDIVADVNRWAEMKTSGMIKNVLPESMKDILFCLANAVSFESAWSWPFEDEDVKDRYFYNADGTKSRVLMLHGSEDSYIENDRFTGFIKPYKDYEFSFMALLPKEGTTSSDQLDDIDFSGLFRSASYKEVHIRLPEFQFDFSQDLNSFCAAQGINEIYSDHADFSPLSSAWLRMQAILHKTYIDVNRAGTRAAAVTLGAVCAGCLPPREFKEVFLDHPFIFAIVHNRTGIPVFVGNVNHLENAIVRPQRLVDRLNKQN